MPVSGAHVIAEALIGSVTAIVLGSLWLAKALTPPDPRDAAYQETRRILERDRAEWAEVLRFGKPGYASDVTKKMAEIDAKLITLADERRDEF